MGAWGLGWEVWLDGLEVTQFTYFQQLGGLELDLVPAEITYGLERLAMFLQGVDSALDLVWAPGITWGDVYRESEREWSTTTSRRRPSTCSCGASASTRRRRCTSSSASCRCPPTTRC